MGALKRLCVVGVMFTLAAIARPALAADPPADLCSLLAASDVSTILGGTYSEGPKTVAPAPYANTVTGTDCHYASGGSQLLFRAYADPTADVATGLFAKLKMFYSPPTPVAGLGDEAYLDPSHGLHVRKGRVRYFLSGVADDKKLIGLGLVVAGKL
ncbi:MAG TPA: hypothetical protein VHZ25_13345 [Acidobacteriaceae bacterium]|jgi:hypothetical protein|nr:hypothetical protein [Acidobacteriaceae bacterium]